ncbi:Transmembrane_domain-containing protein [Hexamita inflata]|uniref:Transmembrane domain-containing protein n=1 Tax=Hexamita inflata TaxID=28002 RepID=A0AA86P872_9EUKA|nr:Transmembrane domain-containing protein [Hexamita inflata]
MSSCCQQLCVKLTYISIVVVVFGIGIFISVDVYLGQMWFNKNMFDQKETIIMQSGVQAAEVRTPITGLIIGSGFYNFDTQCYSSHANKTEEFFYYHTSTTNIYIDGMDYEVMCVNTAYVNNDFGDSLNGVIYQTSIWSTLCGAVVAAILILCIFCCCTGWCRCCCNREAEYTKLKLVYV